jgi:hypothetical protein
LNGDSDFESPTSFDQIRRASFIPKTPTLVKVERHWASTHNPALGLTLCTRGRTHIPSPNRS